MSKLSLTLCTFSPTGSVAGLFLTCMSRSKKIDLIYFILLFTFYFLFDLFFYFLFLEQLGLGLIGHAVTSVTI